ncbi:MAG TPA: hypothetical protein VFB33_07560 [Candidatus Binataceae bacterium]|nr:hypothetical protein [Candidatus Binataceae bacterium]
MAVGFFAGYVSRPLVRNRLATMHPGSARQLAKANIPSPTDCRLGNDGSVWCPSLRPGEGYICVVPPKLPPGLQPRPPISS